MTKYLTFILILFSSLVLAQQKYFIYFKDKGMDSKTILNKTSEYYNDALRNLSPRAIDRRIKNMGEEIINYDDLPIPDNYKEQISALGINIIHELNWFNSVSAYLTDEQIAIVKSLPFVKSIEPVKKLYFKKPYYTNPELLKINLGDSIINYGNSFKQLNLSDVPLVHSKGIYGNDVIIGILDSGFDWKKHESLKNRKVIAEYDFIFNDSVTANQTGDSPSQDSHGTFIFSLLAGYADSVMIGPAFNSSFILAKTEDVRSETHVEEDNYAAALIWMESLGVDITSSSLGYNIFDSGYSYTYNDMDGRTAIVTKAVEFAFQRGVSTFTSAGNEGSTKWKYIIAPADGFNTIAVGAVNEFGNVASFSSQGPTFDGRIKPDIVAFGVNTFGAIAGTVNGYKLNSGTSTSAPIASGVAALLLSAHPHLKNTQIRSIILETASNSSNPNNQIGYGIISAKNAIEFPNLEKVNGGYVLHKIIFEKNINPQSVKIHFKVGDDIFQEYELNQTSEYDYTFTLPQTMSGTQSFNITYIDSMNTIHLLPETGKYKFNYGSDIIFYNLDLQTLAGDFVVSDFYPNPFLPFQNKYVSFNYYTNGSELIRVLIIDGAGQKVKEIKTTTPALPGFYFISWDGFSDQGYLCASGVYYALIQLSGKEYGKKLVLLK